MKTCQYIFEQGMYQTDCGAKLLLRPYARCDKCGRKSEEVRYAINGEDHKPEKKMRS